MPALEIDNTCLGRIVSLKSYPLTSEGELKFIRFSGISEFNSPLMIIKELVHNPKAKFDEEYGFPIIEKNTFKCKCIWFNNKSMCMEEAWFSSSSLNLFDTYDSSESENLKLGQKVILKTSSIESKKKKSYIKENNSKITTTTSDLQSYCSPVMLVIGKVRHESKEPEFNIKKGVKIRWVSENLLKCQFYNYDQGKFSEVLIPENCLSPIKDPNEDVLGAIGSHIKKSDQVSFKITDGQKERECFGKFNSIITVGGNYLADFYNLLSGEGIRFDIKDIVEDNIKMSPTGETYPKFDFEGDDQLIITSIAKILADGLVSFP